MRRKLILLCLLLFSTSTSAFIIDSREWRQVTDTTGFSWNEVAQICPTNHEKCNGEIDGVVFTNWKWASIDDVSDMFVFISNGNFPGGKVRYYEYNSLWADEFLSNFERTQVGSGKGNVVGWTSSTSLTDEDYAYYAFVGDVTLNNYSDQLSTNFDLNKDRSLEGHGFWLYQDLTPVPIPAAVWLFGSGIIGLLGMICRNSNR